MGKLFDKNNRKARILLVVFVISVLCATIVSAAEIAGQNRKFTERECQLISSKVYDSTMGTLNKFIISSRTMASDVFMINILERETEYSEEEITAMMAEYLTMLRKNMNAQTAFVISEKTKRYYTYDGLNKVIDPENDEHDVWYSIFVNSRKDYDLDVDADQVNDGSWTVFVNARVKDDSGRMIGVCGMGFATSDFQELLKSTEASYDVIVNYVNPEGQVQVDNDIVSIDAAYLYDVQHSNEKDGYTYKNKEGRYVVMRYIEPLNWYLVLRGPVGSKGIGKIVPVILTGVLVVAVNLLALFFAGRKKN